MKKYLLRIMLSLLLAVSLIVPINADAVVAVKGATALTGGASGSLDSFDGATLNDGDVCFVFYGTNFYFYKLDADSGLAESSPAIISPDTSAGNKRWILQGTAFAVGSDADGDMYFRDSGVLARIAKGTSGQTLRMNVAATAPEWAAGAATSGRVNKTQADSPYTVAAANLNGLIVFTNTGATGEIIFQLPAGFDGAVFSAVVTAAQYLKLSANGTEKIRCLDTQTAAGGYVRSDVIGNSIQAVWSGTEWVITSIGGAWNYDV